MKKDLKTRLINRKVEKPDAVLMTMAMWVMALINRARGVEFSYDYDPKTIEHQPTILLSSHAARLEFIYTIYGFRRKDVNIVCGYQNIVQKGIYPILLRLGVISKYLYQPDFMCVKNMLRALKRGGSVALFPEGIQSTSGSMHPINPATAQFLKYSKANIVVATTKGAYLSTNRYSSDRKKGYVGVSYRLLFTPEQLLALSEEQVYEQLMRAISYNDFAFNKVARHAYVGKKPNAYGIDKILYKCPACKKEHTLRVEHDTIVCDECDHRVRVNEYYDLLDAKGQVLPYDIDMWYKWQRRCVANEIKDDAFCLGIKASLCTLRSDQLCKAPKNQLVLSVGEARLTNQGLQVTGELNGQRADFDFAAKSLYSLTFSTQGYLEFYYNNEYYMIVPTQKERGLIKWTLASEEINNLYDERWREASEDAYDYSCDKGELV